MVSGLNKGVAVVGANSKAMVEKAQINTAIKIWKTRGNSLQRFWV